MDHIKFGLMLTVLPFSAIIIFVSMWWALVDMSVRQLKGGRRAFWTAMVLVFPPIGSILYNFVVRQREQYDCSGSIAG